jgi:putative peptidoglycan lipid II flippase
VVTRPPGRRDGRRVLLLHSWALLAGSLAGEAGWAVYQWIGGFDALNFDGGVGGTFVSGLWISAVCGTTMLVVYVALLKLFRVRELDSLLVPLRRRLGR